ncbi:MAG: dTMP kinase [Bacteroidales bacterium]|nr:dTMP kinase [Bacteroidales bacterium]
MPLIAFEGLDGSGKSTQIKMLKEYLVKKNLNVYCIHFPRLKNTVFGELISLYLRGELGELDSIHPKLISLLYACDRWQCISKIKRYLNKNYYVLLDRYVYSNIAYQCAKFSNEKQKKELRTWIENLEYNKFKIPKPDYSFFLDVPWNFIKQQLSIVRKGEDRDYLENKEDIHERNLNYLKKVYHEYLLLCKEKELIKINCSQGKSIASIETIFKRIKDILLKK